MALEAILIALDHPELSSDPAILCRAATVCKGWRQAVQQCGACNTHIRLAHVTLHKLASFTTWLPRHASLVRSISIDSNLHTPASGFVKTDPLEYSHLVVQLLQPALQLAALLPAAAATAAAAAAGSGAAGRLSQQQKQQQHGLRLASFNCSAPGGTMTGLLALLPPHSLTELVFEVTPATTYSRGRVRAVHGPALAAALARLSSLQRLCFTDCTQASACSLAAIAQLTQLTNLELIGMWRGADQPLQQLLLQPPPLRELHLGVRQHLQALDMSRLSHLEQLTLHKGLAEGSVLPPMLQRLHMESVSSGRDMAVISSAPKRLQQLRQVTLGVDFYDRAALLQLTTLPALQHVRLEYEDTDAAVDTAPAWKQLPQLQELQLLQSSAPSEEDMQTIRAGVSGATSLTHLVLTAAVLTLDDDNDLHWHSVAACASLTGLSRLQDLRIVSKSMLVAGDALALTALTGLTKLDLSGSSDAVGDVVATALASNLRQLRHLDLTKCRLGDMVCLAAIRNLTQLTELRLEGNKGMTQQGLMLLTGLSHLQQLTVGATEDKLDEFWAAVRQGRQRQQQQQQLLQQH